VQKIISAHTLKFEYNAAQILCRKPHPKIGRKAEIYTVIRLQGRLSVAPANVFYMHLYTGVLHMYGKTALNSE
jgi:hypothetical protein